MTKIRVGSKPAECEWIYTRGSFSEEEYQITQGDDETPVDCTDAEVRVNLATTSFGEAIFQPDVEWIDRTEGIFKVLITPEDTNDIEKMPNTGYQNIWFDDAQGNPFLYARGKFITEGTITEPVPEP